MIKFKVKVMLAIREMTQKELAEKYSLPSAFHYYFPKICSIEEGISL